MPDSIGLAPCGGSVTSCDVTVKGTGTKSSPLEVLLKLLETGNFDQFTPAQIVFAKVISGGDGVEFQGIEIGDEVERPWFS